MLSIKKPDARRYPMAFFLGICLSICLMSSVSANTKKEAESPSWESRCYLMEGIYHFIDKGDLDTAEDLFRKAILSSSISSLSQEAEDRYPNSQVVAEAFYFLGRINYERANLGDQNNVAWAKMYLKKAEEYGIVHDRLHPPLLDEINRRYPGTKLPVSRASRDKAKITIETNQIGSYRLDAVKVDQHTDVAESKFVTNKELDLDGGTRYKMKLDIRGSYRVMYGALAVLGISIATWLTRD